MASRVSLVSGPRNRCVVSEGPCVFGAIGSSSSDAAPAASSGMSSGGVVGASVGAGGAGGCAGGLDLALNVVDDVVVVVFSVVVVVVVVAGDFDALPADDVDADAAFILLVASSSCNFSSTFSSADFA